MNIKLIRVKFHLKAYHHHHHHHHHIGYLALLLSHSRSFCLHLSFSVPMLPSLDSSQWLQVLSSAIVAMMASGDLGETILSVRARRRMGPFR